MEELVKGSLELLQLFQLEQELKTRCIRLDTINFWFQVNWLETP